MYRKHLQKMETIANSSSKTSAATGIKTIDHISEIPAVNAALSNVTDYYSKVKERNTLFRTSFNLAEMSIKTMALAATPIASLCKKPIESVDTYLCDKLTEFEHSYPVIVKPTEQLSATLNTQAKLIYNKTVQEPIDMLNNIKERTISYGANTVQAVVKVGVDSVDAALENKFAKMLTNPVLDFTERSLDYWIPSSASAATSSSSSVATEGGDDRTLRRLYDINNRLCRHVYQTTFTQLNFIHAQFESTITRLQTLKNLTDSVYSGSKERLENTLETVKKNSLVSQCITLIDKNNLSLDKLEGLSRAYSKAILTDVMQMLEKYMTLVKNFPVVFNGTRLMQTVDNLMNQLNKGSFSVYLTSAIDQIKSIHTALLSYTNQMLQVINDSRLANMLKRTPSQFLTKENHTIIAPPQPQSQTTLPQMAKPKTSNNDQQPSNCNSNNNNSQININSTSTITKPATNLNTLSTTKTTSTNVKNENNATTTNTVNSSYTTPYCTPFTTPLLSTEFPTDLSETKKADFNQLNPSKIFASSDPQRLVFDVNDLLSYKNKEAEEDEEEQNEEEVENEEDNDNTMANTKTLVYREGIESFTYEANDSTNNDSQLNEEESLEESDSQNQSNTSSNE